MSFQLTQIFKKKRQLVTTQKPQKGGTSFTLSLKKKKKVKINLWNPHRTGQTDEEECPDTDTPVSQCLETSLRGSKDSVQSEVVNQNESRDLGNTNTNIVLPNTTALTSLIKTQDLPSHASITEQSSIGASAGILWCVWVAWKHLCASCALLQVQLWGHYNYKYIYRHTTPQTHNTN